MKEKILKNVFDNLEKSLCNEMAIRIGHNLEDGKYREYLMKRVLEKIIPSKYEITNGFVIDSDNNQSDEMDVIIYDKSYVPPFFDETYTIVPIEAVIAVIQIKTTLTNKQLELAVDNLNSIDKLNAKTGGKIISAKGGELLEEQRYLLPYKIIVSYKTDINKNYWFEEEMKSVDMIYILDKKERLVIKHRNSHTAVVNSDKTQLISENKEFTLEKVKDSRLCIFSLNLLDKMKLINNAIIINYDEYIKGAK